MSTAETDADTLKPDKKGWAKRWQMELHASKEALAKYVEQGLAVDKVFRDEREATTQGETHWTLFSSDILTMVSMLYGNAPKADVSRRFGDATDDVGRIAGEIAERLLHTDLEKAGDTTQEAVGNALLDWLLPAGGFVRVRYAAKFEQVEAAPEVLDEKTGEVESPAVEAGERIASEEAPIDYVHWQDFRWSPCRVWSEVTWVAFAAEMPKKAFLERFSPAASEDAEADKAVGEALWQRMPKQSKGATDEEKARDPWARARVWEIWHKEEKQVFWYVEGFDEVLDVQEDPLQLDGFWPCPRPLFANLTTSKLVPRSSYYLAQDLYLEINRVSTRIDRLQRAIKVAGLYDSSNPEIARVLDEAVENELLPVKNWAAFIEKGGMKGAMDFLPLEAMANALAQLRDYRRELVDALYQVTGKADIMRGQASTPGTSATEQSIKAKFGSVRIQRMQDEFARFVSEAQALKLEVISKHFQPETIIERSNAKYAFTEDAQLVPQAVELLKSQYACYRVQVKPEALALTDFAQLKSDKTEVIGALSQFLTAAAPLVQAMPDSMPFLLKLLQATLSGLKGSSTMEGILDAAIQAMEAKQKEAAMQPKQPPPPDPKVQAQQLKMQGDAQRAQADIQKLQLKGQQDLQQIQAETIAHDQQEQSQMKWNVAEQAQKQLISNALKPREPLKPGGFP